jgi:hypothetical protein
MVCEVESDIQQYPRDRSFLFKQCFSKSILVCTVSSRMTIQVSARFG